MSTLRDVPHLSINTRTASTLATAMALAWLSPAALALDARSIALGGSSVAKGSV